MSHLKSSFLRRIAPLALVLGLAATTAAADDAAIERNLGVDLQLAAFDDPVIVRQRLAAPAVWLGPRGAQPFNQEPPAAQSNFCPGTLTQVIFTIPRVFVAIRPNSCP